MKITVIGIGLIGGSMALDLKKRAFASHVIGVDKNAEHIDKALELGIINESKSLEEAVPDSDLVIVAIPVDQTPKVLISVLDLAGENTIIIDVGSIKGNICEAVKNHPNRSQFVACHPIAGTEYSGPDAAHYYLFDGKINILTDTELSGNITLETAKRLFETLKMKTIEMDSKEHDRHIAYVSHLSHITSFTLGLTVLNLEKDENNIFNMAGSGFASTVRLAKSSPDMWTPIFKENAPNLDEAIDAYIDQLQRLKKFIKEGDSSAIHNTIEASNKITSVLEGIENKDRNTTLKL